MTTTREVRPDQHGTYTGYTYGCRCDGCSRAMSAYQHRDGSQADCIGPHDGKSFRCQVIAGSLRAAQAEVARVARLANRDAARFAKYREELEAAKAVRDGWRKNRDDHMAECPGALARWTSPTA